MLVALSRRARHRLAVGFPAMASIMPSLVPREQLQRANALVSLAALRLVILGPTVERAARRHRRRRLGPRGRRRHLAGRAPSCSVAVPPPARRARQPTSTVAELREGWTFFAVHDVAVGRRPRLRRPQRHPRRRVVHARPGPRQGHHRRAGLGPGPLGRGRRPAGDDPGAAAGPPAAPAAARHARHLAARRPDGRCSARSPTCGSLVAAAFVAGAGTEVFSMGWNLAMQEHVPDEMLLARLLLRRPRLVRRDPGRPARLRSARRRLRLHRRAGRQRRRLRGDLLLVLLSRSVRGRSGLTGPAHRRRRAGSAPLLPTARITVRLRLVATPSCFSTSTLVSRASCRSRRDQQVDRAAPDVPPARPGAGRASSACDRASGVGSSLSSET